MYESAALLMVNVDSVAHHCTNLEVCVYEELLIAMIIDCDRFWNVSRDHRCPITNTTHSYLWIQQLYIVLTLEREIFPIL